MIIIPKKIHLIRDNSMKKKSGQRVGKNSNFTFDWENELNYEGEHSIYVEQCKSFTFDSVEKMNTKADEHEIALSSKHFYCD